MRVGVIIVAAGRGTRLGADLPKQYLPLGGKLLIEHCLQKFLAHPDVTAVQMVIDLAERHRFEHYADHAKFCPPVAGGNNRQQSVFCGLQALHDEGCSHVLIHDGARPFIADSLIDRLIDALADNAAVLPILPIADTLKTVGDGLVRGEQDRRQLARAQTPQAFEFAMILAAHNQFAGQEFTDDAGLAAAAGHAVTTILGDEMNYKVTSVQDLSRARADVSRPRKWRTAQGYDVHRLVTGRPLILAGVTIPHDMGLDGHSDADVAMHALTDAILGLTANGDIGSHFPPSDPQWAGAASDQFLLHSLKLLQAAGGELDHVDLMIICEAPKIGPHRAAMQAKLAELLGLPAAAISIKATTNERLGFLGRSEGIAALGMASASLPAEIV